MATHRINVSLPEDLVALLDAHTGTGGRSAYIAATLRRALVADSLAKVADHNGGALPYADELDGLDDTLGDAA
ncbi:ribbon-helix-helix domain-containing protein [Actinomadura harenae]|uniref:ribbon-helix-helix domain-containing protein n=1 Tax=Actinomadura harenae TaxID=2483351 RepID=UPI0011C3433B|nr:ribbon-helix-helix domain-containing protein [Actinomadura harenae]